MLATGEKTPTPARRAAPSSSEPSPFTKKVHGDVAPVPVVAVGAGLGLMLEAPCRGGTAMGTGTGAGTAMAVREADESMSAIFDSEFGGSFVTNEDLWEVEAVGSPRVRAMT